MAETMQGQRKWGYQTLHWWREYGGDEISSWSAHMNPRSETSIHRHECTSTIVCAYGSLSVWSMSRGMFNLTPGQALFIDRNDLHSIKNNGIHQCGFLEVYRGAHENHEPVTHRIERMDEI